MFHKLFIGIILLIPVTAWGQEFIKEVSVKSTNSIVREVGYQEWLTYTYHYGMSIFTLASETGVTAPTLELPNYYNISDFEIYNDTVYFCGRADSGSIVALFGYFSLVSFPYSSVYCCHIQSLKELKKLAIYNNGNKPHVVFTGTMGKNKSVLSDAIISSYNSWDFAIAYDTYIDDLIFDDVAVTDDYIVSSSRIFNLDSGLIQYFHKPPTYHTMFPYYYITRSI